MHKNLIYAATKFFRDALAGPVMEAQTGVVELPEEDPLVFKALIDWLYGKYPGTSAARSFLRMSKGEDVWHLYWFNLFAMADRLLLPGLQVFAWNRIKAIFNPERRVSPSNELLEVITSKFLKDLSEPAFGVASYILHHLHFWLRSSEGLAEELIVQALSNVVIPGYGPTKSLPFPTGCWPTKA